MASTRRSESDGDDVDYFPPEADEGSLSSDDEQPDSKRGRIEMSKLGADEEASRKKALWDNFEASVNESRMTEPAPKKFVKIWKRYRFAGEEVTEVVEVLEDSPDAKKWPLWQPPDKKDPSEMSSTTCPTLPTTEIAINTGTTLTSATFPPGKRPGPRKPKTQLPDLPRQSSTKATKLTTLNKSVMDWKAHVQSSEHAGLHDELEANRRGGGYLEKVEFLQRVDDRKDAMLEASNSTKRKRG